MEYLKKVQEAMWFIVARENVLIDNQNIDWLLERSSKAVDSGELDIWRTEKEARIKAWRAAMAEVKA